MLLSENNAHSSLFSLWSLLLLLLHSLDDYKGYMESYLYKQIMNISHTRIPSFFLSHHAYLLTKLISKASMAGHPRKMDWTKWFLGFEKQVYNSTLSLKLVLQYQVSSLILRSLRLSVAWWKYRQLDLMTSHIQLAHPFLWCTPLYRGSEYRCTCFDHRILNSLLRQWLTCCWYKPWSALLMSSLSPSIDFQAKLHDERRR